MAVVITISAIVIGVLALFGGIVGFVKWLDKPTKQKSLLNKKDAALYKQAAKILNRLEGITDLDGAYAGDVLSPETRKQVTEWMADYRKELNK